MFGRRCIHFFYCSFSPFLPSQASETPWILIVSDDPRLAANLVTRGCDTVNVLQLVPSPQHADDLKAVAEDMKAALLKADELIAPDYTAVVYPNLTVGFFVACHANASPPLAFPLRMHPPTGSFAYLFGCIVVDCVITVQ